MSGPATIVPPERVLAWEAEIRRAIQRTEDARAFSAEIRRIAAAYPPEAAHTPRKVRERHFSPAQRLAWALRFGAEDDAMRAAIDEVASYLQDALL